MKKLQIIMSTYNGNKYIREQLDSILNQDCQEFQMTDLSILVRDDGSTDGTQDILQEYASKYPQQIQWYQGENCGVIQSFFDLVTKVDADTDYLAFSDQDDYWMPEKMTRGIEMVELMEQESGEQKLPYLYCCRPKLVDEKLQMLHSEIKRPPMRPGFGNALVENIATGCTMVMNRTLYQMARNGLPEFTVMHDWWFYLISTCFGKCFYDETPYICYRQHGGNVLGSNVSRIKELQDRLRRFKGNRNNLSRQINCFLEHFGDVSELDITISEDAKKHLQLAQELLNSKQSLTKRMALVHRHEIYRQRTQDDRIFRWILRWGSF